MARGAQFSLRGLLRCRCRARSESQLRSFLAFVSTQFRLSISRRNRPRLDRCLALLLSLSLLAIDHSMSPLRFTAPQQSTPPTHARWGKPNPQGARSPEQRMGLPSPTYGAASSLRRHLGNLSPPAGFLVVVLVACAGHMCAACVSSRARAAAGPRSEVDS
ncbi:hypothetical protein B0H11DRAFT_2121742, partial [Mycena galericulata]